MGTVSHYIEVNAPVAESYEWWRGLTNLPRIMPDVEEISTIGPERTHWRVEGPLGKSVEWDAKIIEDIPNSKIAWASIDGDVKTSGAVRFDDRGSETAIEISLDYDPPAGVLGEAGAKLFADPQSKEGSGWCHMPSGSFAANAAWMELGAMAHNLARWTARIGELSERIITTPTLRRKYLTIPGHVTRSGRRTTLHLADNWPWRVAYLTALEKVRALPALP